MLKRRSKKLSAWSLRGAATAALLLAATSAFAQAPPLPGTPSAASGHQLAQRLCVGCHVIDTGGTTAAPATGVPTFRAIANQTGQSGSRIKDRLIAPPHQMPDMLLTLREIDDILAYLETLRAAPSAPSFLPEKGDKDKPSYPKPS